MPAKITYPWFFFFRVAQLSVLTSLPGLLALIYFDREIFLKALPVFLLGQLAFIFMFYHASRPLGGVLAKVQKFKADLPYGKTLKHLYRKDEWAQIEEALSKADQRLQDQVNQTRTENEKIGAILESINDHIIAIDPYETVLFFNTNFKRDFMSERRQGEIMPKVWHTIDDEAVLKAFRTVLSRGESVSLKRLNFLSSKHPERWFDLNITPLKDPAGQISGALGVFYDVTDFKLTEQMRVDFVANVSHEIRTPLTSIKGYTQIMQAEREKIDPSLHLFLEKIVANTERMITLFNDLLSLSVIESGKGVGFEEFSLAPLIEHMHDSVKANYPDKDITVLQELGLSRIKGEERLLEQVLSNLADNACKYSGRKDVVIKVSSRKEGSRARVIIEDNGPGIPKEHLQRVFERFYRVETSREASRGTGLGLSIVKHIIAKHGGKIWAENRETGTAFILDLPLE